MFLPVTLSNDLVAVFNLDIEDIDRRGLATLRGILYIQPLLPDRGIIPSLYESQVRIQPENRRRTICLPRKVPSIH